MREICMSGSMSGVWRRSHGRTSEAPPNERGGNRYVRPTVTAPHLDSTMDMIFRDDECRVPTNTAPANFTTIKHTAHNLLRTASTKDSMRLRRKVAAWDDDFLASLIAA